MPYLRSRIAGMGDNVRASLFMTGSMAAFAVNDALVKLSTQTLEPMQIMAVRGVIASALLIAIAMWRKVGLSIGTVLHPMVLLRTAGDIGATIAYISALRHLPLANASAVFQALPLTVTIGAALFYREMVGWRRWLAIGIGLCGVLIILRPGTDGFNSYSIWVLLSVLFAAARDLVTRRMPRSISSIQVAASTSIAVMATGFAFLPVAGWQPLTPDVWIYLCAAAVAIALGYLMIVSAMRIGDMGFVAPFRYTILLFAFVFGIAVFGEWPDWVEIAGSIIVVSSGAYMIHRETRKGIIFVPKAQTH